MLKIQDKKIGCKEPVYFIAEIGSNFDGSFERAISLIRLAADHGADAVKFQHYHAKNLVSDYGFNGLPVEAGHQKNWSSSVYNTYQAASLDPAWTKALAREAEKCGLHFLTSAYSHELVDAVMPFVPAYKIGSGDITWTQLLEHIAKKGKPVILATGASSLDEVKKAFNAINKYNNKIIILQCNTNYENNSENFKYLNLNVLKTYRKIFPKAVLGLSDHTKNFVSTLGAVALGASVIEKHFTDDDTRSGPDHAFALTPKEWKQMVDHTRELEAAMGSKQKKIEKNEVDTIIVQRRAIRAVSNLNVGSSIKSEDVEMLRPCTNDGLPPYMLNEILGRKVIAKIAKGAEIKLSNLELNFREDLMNGDRE